MSLIILGTDPCWKVLHEQVKVLRPELCDKNILLCVNCFLKQQNTKTIVWLHESPAIVKNIIDEIDNNPDQFKDTIVYTCVESLLKYSFVRYIHPSNSTWISNPKYMPTKTKLVSMISSNKNFTHGHSLRHSVIQNLPYCVDLYGRGFKEISNKSEGLEQYCFSIAIENDDTDCYFSEKLLDCFLTCTIPIYWGAKKVSTIFNNDGILWLNDTKDICSLTYMDYNSRTKAIQENYNIAINQNIDPINSLIKILEEN
jgi:hypothetical protein